EEELKKAFRPEFLNRIDEIVVFSSLTEDQIHAIVDRLMAEVRERLAERDVKVELTPAATDWLAREGYDPAYGARPLRRAVQRQIENPLSKKLLKGEVKEGDTVVVDAEDGRLVFREAA